MSKEASTAVIRSFVDFATQVKTSRERELTADAEHQESSLSLYSTGKRILDEYGKKHSRELDVGAGGKIYGMRFDAVNFRSTPKIAIKTEKGEMLLTVAEDFTTGPNYYKVKDRIKIRAFFKGKWSGLFDISRTKSETKNWLDKKATPEQIQGLGGLFSMIETALKEKQVESVSNKSKKRKTRMPISGVKEMREH